MTDGVLDRRLEEFVAEYKRLWWELYEINKEWETLFPDSIKGSFNEYLHHLTEHPEVAQQIHDLEAKLYDPYTRMDLLISMLRSSIRKSAFGNEIKKALGVYEERRRTELEQEKQAGDTE